MIKKRKKVVELEGGSYTISPLSLSEVEAYTEAIPDESMTLQEKSSFLANAALMVVVNGLNGALEESTPPWDIKKVKDEFDMDTFQQISKAIFDYSGLRQAGEPGEAQATK